MCKPRDNNPRLLSVALAVAMAVVTACASGTTQSTRVPAMTTVPTLAPVATPQPAPAGRVLFGRGMDIDTNAILDPVTTSAVGEEVYAVGRFDRTLPTGPVRVRVTLNGADIASYDEGTSADTEVSAAWLIVPAYLITEAGELSVVISDFGNQPVASGVLPISP